MATKKQRTLSDKMRQVISTHRRHRTGVLLGLVGSGVVAAGALGLILIGALSGDRNLLVGFLVVGAIALLAAGLVAGLCGYAAYVKPSEVRIYPFGIKWTARRTTYEYDWDEVAEVYHYEVVTVTNQGRSRDASVKLVFEDGTELTCSNALKNYDKLASRVLSETANALLAKARTQLKDGVDFGPIELSRKGVTIEDEFYPYDELRQTRVRNGHVLFYFPEKQKYEFPLSTVPNYLVLFGLLEELGKGGIIDQRPDPD